MTLGQKIRFYREKQRMGQENLAELAHISVSTIRKYEADERRPKEEQIEKLAIALHISPAALKDNTFNGFIDVLPALYGIGKWGDITFEGEKDSEGKYIKESLSIRFKNPDIMEFLSEWADKKEELDSVKEAATLVKDTSTRQMMNQRVEDLSQDLENQLVMEKISKEIYFEEGLPNQIPSKAVIKDTPKLKKYIDILDVLYSLSLSSGIRFECVGIFERIWDPQAIITFEADSVIRSNMSASTENDYARFLYYFRECKRIGLQTDGFAFMQGGTKYYRYIIKDRILAGALDIIRESLDFPWRSVDGFEIKRKKADLESKLKYYDIPIEVEKNR